MSNSGMTGTRETTMHIGAVAERTGLSLRTLRHYDEVGLLRPSGRTDGGFRLYTEADATRLLLIRRMKPLGFTLEEMADLLTIVDAMHGTADIPPPIVSQHLSAYIAAAESRRADLANKLAMADEFIALLRDHDPESPAGPDPIAGHPDER